MMCLAELDTGSFSFRVVRPTEAQARTALERAWAKHREQTGATPWSEWAEAVNVYPISPSGPVLRDGSPLV